MVLQTLSQYPRVSAATRVTGGLQTYGRGCVFFLVWDNQIMIAKANN